MDGKEVASPFPTVPIPLPFGKKFPVEKVISDLQGRQLDSEILGRSETELFVVRKSDGMEFTVPIANLTQADRNFAISLPKTPAPPGFGQSPKKTKKPEDHQYIKSREAAIVRLLEKNRILESENLETNNTMLLKSRYNQIKKNTEEISELKSDIARYKIDNNLD